MLAVQSAYRKTGRCTGCNQLSFYISFPQGLRKGSLFCFHWIFTICRLLDIFVMHARLAQG